MADNKEFDIEKYYKNLSRAFKGGSPVFRQRIATKITPPGQTHSPVGTARAFLKSTTNLYASQMASYGMYSRLSRYSDYSEMESQSIIASALDIYSDEVCTKDEHGEMIKIFSHDQKIRKILQSFFYDVLNIDFNLWTWARNFLKYGDQFLLVDHHPNHGILQILPMPVNEVEREEGFDQNDPLAYRYRWSTQGNRTLDPWQVIHFRNGGNDSFAPYGCSVIEPVRRTWRQLCGFYKEKVWIKDCGYKELKDVVGGDTVIGFDLDKKVSVETKVVACKSMGKQKLVEIQTAHRNIKVTPNHGVLVYTKNKEFVYKQAQELMCSQGKGGWDYACADKLVLLNSWEFENDFYEVSLPKELYEGRASPRKQLFNNSSFKTTPQFMRFFGFMFGDGWITKERKSFGFALGVNEKQNDFYINLVGGIFNLDSFNLKPAIKNSGANVTFYSKEIVRLLEVLDFHTGYKNKQIPSWVYSLNKENKINFIRGLFDADGCYTDGRLTLANKELIESVRILCQQTGIAVGKEIKLDREAGIYKDSCFGKIKRNSDSYRLFINLDDIDSEPYSFESVNRVVAIDEDETYDLQVEHNCHNFVLNGIVSHNTLLEDAVMTYRIVRSPERRVFYIDVGGIDPNDVPTFIEKVKGQLKRNNTVDASTGNLDKRFNPMPIRHDSVISLLDGRNITIKELAKEYEQGKENWVYSIHDQKHNLVPGKVIWCGKNYTANKLLKIILDDGSSVVTAPEHPFILRDGSPIRADQLKSNDALMASYTKINKKGYEECYDPSIGKYVKTHKFVALSIYPKEMKETALATVHHKEPWLGELNKTNNIPSNLQVMNFWDHKTYHQENMKFGIQRPDVKEKILQKLIEYNSSELHEQHNEVRSKAQLKSWKKNYEKRITAFKTDFDKKCFEFLDQTILSMFVSNKYDILDLNKITNSLNENIEFLQYYSSVYGSKKTSKTSRPLIMRKIRELGFKDYKEYVCEHLKIDYFSLRKEIRSKRASETNAIWSKNILRDEKGRITGFYRNHKVKEIIDINDANDDVYCMTVVGPNGEEDRHNFAVKTAPNSLIFLKNSILDDYYIPVRGDMTSTRIESLPGGQYVGDIDDLKFHLDKLFAGLKIPKSYLGYEGEVNARSTLSQEDINFARTIARLQNIVVAELNKMAIIQLFSAGYRGEEVMNFDLSMASPSIITEIQRLELWRTRFEVSSVASTLEGGFDRRFSYKKLFKLSDEEIEEIEEGRRKDKLFDMELESIAPPPTEEIPPEGEVPPPPEGGVAAGEAPAAQGEQPPAGEPPVPETEKPITTAGRDPNQQRIMPNGVKGKTKKRKSSNGLPTNLTQVFNFKKTALDPRDGLIQNTRVGTTPFGESLSMGRMLTEDIEETDEEFSKQQLQARLIRHESLLKQLEGIRWANIKTSPPPIGSDVLPVEDDENKKELDIKKTGE